ncbi:MAG: UvrD-helicase domain-containing protein [Bacteroidales bacterium]|jgi:ATP-dependent exoDNAse (exonuclease V) beta subunit|nr:UvrD-helicase domain-containing protein [Bacteroidales bacterium]
MSNHKSFIVYQASAGSGKTYTLAKEYIKICLQHFPQDRFMYRKILAITFTNKAVNEMKERILLFLEMLASGEESHLLQELSDGISKEEIRIRSAKVLDLIHHDYGNFSICTIDSLFQRIVRSFAIDLKIPLNHQLELDTDSMMSQIVDLILSKLGYDQSITDAVVNFSFFNIENEKNWKIEKELASIGKQIYNETAIPYLKKIKTLCAEDFIEIIKTLYAQITAIETSVRRSATEAVRIIADNSVPFDAFYQGKKGIGQWFLNKSEGLFKSLSGNSYILKAVNEDVWYSSTCSCKHAIEAISGLLREQYVEIAKHEQDYLLLSAMLRNIYPVALLNEIRRTAEELKHTDKLLHISEANITIAETVKNEPVPFVYERIGERYSVIFIDEFQDTSHLQWQNLLPLVTETLSSGAANGNTGKTILFGDAKQAIYRFRGGDVRQFVALPNVSGSDLDSTVKEREKTLQHNFSEEFLQKNYRSKKEVVTFNNTFFAWLADKKEKRIQDIYRHVKQQVQEDNAGGAVFFTGLLKDDEQNYNQLAMSEVLRNIHHAKQSGYAYEDIAILVRGNDFGAEIARYLLENAIPTISAESLLLAKNREIIFLVACLSYLSNVQVVIARGVILNFIAEEKNIAKEKVLPLAKDNTMFIEFIQKQGYHFNPDMLSYKNLYERVEELLQVFDLIQHANPFILAFLDVVVDFLQMPNKAEFQFLDYWEEKKNKFSLSNPKGIDAVTVMSIHQSKGLEFPVVIYPHKKPYQASKDQWVHLPEPVHGLAATLLKPKDMEGTIFQPLLDEEILLTSIDDLNIEYVCFTRAKDRLYFIAQQGYVLWDEIETFLTKHQQIEASLSENTSSTCYCYGNPLDKSDVGTRKENISTAYIQNYVSLPISASIAASSHHYFQEEKTPARWGTKVHDYLAKIYRKEDVETWTAAIAADREMEADVKNNLIAILRNVFSSKESDVLFGEDTSTVQNEIEIIDSTGNSFRIDRLCLCGKKCVLFDYKTGAEKEEHHTQIAHYEHLLRDAGYEVEKKYLIYIQDNLQVKFQQS